MVGSQEFNFGSSSIFWWQKNNFCFHSQYSERNVKIIWFSTANLWLHMYFNCTWQMCIFKHNQWWCKLSANLPKICRTSRNFADSWVGIEIDLTICSCTTTCNCTNNLQLGNYFTNPFIILLFLEHPTMPYTFSNLLKITYINLYYVFLLLECYLSLLWQALRLQNSDNIYNHMMKIAVI